LPTPLSDARDTWLRRLHAKGASDATLDIYSSAVDRLLEWLRANHRATSVEKITRSDIEGFLIHLQETRSQGTAHNRYRSLKAFFNYCADEDDIALIERSPMRKMDPPQLDDVPVPLLAPEQVDALWRYTERPGRDFTRRRDAAIIRLFLASGIRAGEMAALRFSDMNLKAQILTVAGKGRKWRHVPYSAAAAVALDRYLVSRPQSKWAQRMDFVWLGVKGHMTRSGIQQMLERTGDKLGIPGLHPHRLRHVCVDALFSQGMSEQEVMALMGWSSSAMCRRYAAARRAQRAIDTYRRLGIGDPWR
jgi:site-specific recombinase XerD